MDDFSKHVLVYAGTLAVVCLGAAIGAPGEVLVPLAQGLGIALPTLLGAHGLTSAAAAWKGGTTTEAAPAAGDSK